MPQMFEDSLEIDGDSLQYVLDKAHELMKKYDNLKTYEDFSVHTREADYSDSSYCHLYFKRLETEQETVRREKKEAETAAYRELWDRQNYEALKAKFEGKS